VAASIKCATPQTSERAKRKKWEGNFRQDEADTLWFELTSGSLLV
jgi:hypothetical protein